MGDDLRLVRRRRRLSLRQMGALAGTSAATLHAYEHGKKWPSWPTFERVVRAAGFVPVIDLIPMPSPASYPVAALVGDLRVTGEDDRLRLINEFVDRWHESTQEQREWLIRTDPGLCEDQRWDALVAGTVEHLCWHAGLRAPEWVGDPARFLATRWWPVDLPIVRTWSMSDAPVALSRRGVMLSRADLERV